MILTINFLTNYLYLLKKERKNFAFIRILNTSRQAKALSKLASFETKKIHKSGSGFLEVFKSTHTKVVQTNRVKAFVRRYVLQELRECAKDCVRILRLVYLLRVTKMNTEVSRKVFLKQLVQLWRFNCALQNTARKKMQSLHKNFNELFQTVTKEIFGKKPDSLRNEYYKLSEKLGTFSNDKSENSLVQEAMKKHNVINSKRKYVFKNNFNAVPLPDEKNKKSVNVLRTKSIPYWKKEEEGNND
jgi:hypothetical protein